jgi:hypothetical protein
VLPLISLFEAQREPALYTPPPMPPSYGGVVAEYTALSRMRIDVSTSAAAGEPTSMPPP